MDIRPSAFVAGIAQRVADRDAIDWDVSEREPSLDAAHQRLVRELRTIEKIACARVERRTTSESSRGGVGGFSRYRQRLGVSDAVAIGVGFVLAVGFAGSRLSGTPNDRYEMRAVECRGEGGRLVIRVNNDRAWSTVPLEQPECARTEARQETARDGSRDGPGGASRESDDELRQDAGADSAAEAGADHLSDQPEPDGSIERRGKPSAVTASRSVGRAR